MLGTLLTKRWYESRGRLYLEYWVRLDEGAGRVVIDCEPAVFFVDRDRPTRAGTRRAVALASMAGAPVDAVYFGSQRTLMDERDRLLRDEAYLAMEADVWPSDRFLMERFITGTMKIDGEPLAPSKRRNGVLEWRNPKLSAGGERLENKPHELRLLSFDIETEGLDGRVLSIAGVCGDQSRVFVDRPDVDSEHFTSCDGEAAVIAAFQAWLIEVDPDVLTGWNVIGFDLRVLINRAQKHGMRLELGRGRGRTTVRKTARRGGMIADIEGRVVLDGRPTLQASGYYAERYSLEYTAQNLLGEGKTLFSAESKGKLDDKAAEIMRLYHDEPDQLAVYNLKDCVLVQRIFDKQDLLGFVLERQQLTGLALDRIGGSVAAFDYLYLPRLHRRGRVAQTIDNDADGADSPGGFVMESTPGLFRNVVVLDFKSLYPSIIRTFKVDPYALVTAERLLKGQKEDSHDLVSGFREAWFHREDHILPALIEELWEARDEAKKRGDRPRSTAIKVLMNSFYGVLGTTGCRFFDPRLASSITMRGHQILKESRDLIEEKGFEVVYGDTDSVFVRVGDEHAPDKAGIAGPLNDKARAIGQRLAADINDHWRAWCEREHSVTSHLEMEFETHYLRFYLPTRRNSSKGSKKRYAGQVIGPNGQPEVVVKGLEAVRTDWTPLARRFQLELFRRVFSDELDGITEWVKSEVRAVREGERDEDLVYTKRLRRHPAEYTNTPPHVAAALIKGGNPRSISYFITRNGPQPEGMVDATLDYEHYIDKQLQPAAEGILEAIGVNFERLAARQVWLL